MEFNQYQQEARKTAIYPDLGNNFVYPTLGLSGEAGEVAEKIKKVIHFVVKYFHESLTSKHVIKIIKSLHNDSVSYIVANFIHFDLFRKIETDFFLAFLKEKQLEGVPSNYLRDLINGYMERKPALDYCSGLQPIQKFIKTYNRENPKSPIEASKSLINYHFWHQSV
jgi:hypothetical protein